MNIKIFNISFYVENQEVKSLVTNFSFIKKKTIVRRVLSHLNLVIKKVGVSASVSLFSQQNEIVDFRLLSEISDLINLEFSLRIRSFHHLGNVSFSLTLGESLAFQSVAISIC